RIHPLERIDQRDEILAVLDVVLVVERGDDNVARILRAYRIDGALNKADEDARDHHEIQKGKHHHENDETRGPQARPPQCAGRKIETNPDIEWREHLLEDKEIALRKACEDFDLAAAREHARRHRPLLDSVIT